MQHMSAFHDALQHWPHASFGDALMRELRRLPAGSLPLQQCIAPGSYVDDSNLQLTLISTRESTHQIAVRLGVFFTEIVASCGCGDDPLRQPAYGELQVCIDKATAQAHLLACPR